METCILLTILAVMTSLLLYLDTNLDKIQSFTILIALLLLIWLGAGKLFLFGHTYENVTQKCKIAKGEDFVVFNYNDLIVTSKDYKIIQNPQSVEVIYGYPVNIYNEEIPGYSKQLKIKEKQ